MGRKTRSKSKWPKPSYAAYSVEIICRIGPTEFSPPHKSPDRLYLHTPFHPNPFFYKTTSWVVDRARPASKQWLVLVADLSFFSCIQSRQNFLNLVVVEWNLCFLFDITYTVPCTCAGLVCKKNVLTFLADRTNGRAIATLLRLSSSSSSSVCLSLCDVM